MKKQNGITLIALIITIVVLLILATVTINLTLGERGIFNTAQQAGKNYKKASDKELADLSNLEQEMQNAINGTGNGTTKPEQELIKLNMLGAEHYGDYVKYDIPDPIGHGPDVNAHKTDWRIFYNDGTYVYLISSYFLLNSKLPTETGMSVAEGKPYAIFWASEPTTYTIITDTIRKNYKMSWNNNTTKANIKCVSNLLNTNNWVKLVNPKYAEDAIGSPTLEMWVESWNLAKVGGKLYCNNSNDNGYYLGTETNPTTTYTVVENNNNLYFPVESYSDSEGGYYWLASPSNFDNISLMRAAGGCMDQAGYGNNIMSLRPIVRLKADVVGKKVNGIWELQ